MPPKKRNATSNVEGKGTSRAESSVVIVNAPQKEEPKKKRAPRRRKAVAKEPLLAPPRQTGATTTVNIVAPSPAPGNPPPPPPLVNYEDMIRYYRDRDRSGLDKALNTVQQVAPAVGSVADSFGSVAGSVVDIADAWNRLNVGGVNGAPAPPAQAPTPIGQNLVQRANQVADISGAIGNIADNAQAIQASIGAPSQPASGSIGTSTALDWAGQPSSATPSVQPVQPSPVPPAPSASQNVGTSTALEWASTPSSQWVPEPPSPPQPLTDTQTQLVREWIDRTQPAPAPSPTPSIAPSVVQNGSVATPSTEQALEWASSVSESSNPYAEILQGNVPEPTVKIPEKMPPPPPPAGDGAGPSRPPPPPAPADEGAGPSRPPRSRGRYYQPRDLYSSGASWLSSSGLSRYGADLFDRFDRIETALNPPNATTAPVPTYQFLDSSAESYYTS